MINNVADISIEIILLQ